MCSRCRSDWGAGVAGRRRRRRKVRAADAPLRRVRLFCRTRWRHLAAFVIGVASLAPSSCRQSVPSPPAPNAERAFADLRAQVDCGPRVVNRPGVECCRRYIVSTLTPLAERVAAQRFSMPDPYGGDSLRFVNLQANFHTQRPARVLLAAHYDTRPRADQDSGAARDLPIPGANDGASGVAV